MNLSQEAIKIAYKVSLLEMKADKAVRDCEYFKSRCDELEGKLERLNKKFDSWQNI